MGALTSPFFGWPLENNSLSQSHQQSYIFGETIESSPHNYFPQPKVQLHNLHRSESLTTTPDIKDPSMVKKLYHNANERHRRKKINFLYSSLRSLLPAIDNSKKLSNPSTVSRVVKYIPELQKEVKKLVDTKEALLSRIPKQREDVTMELCEEKQRKNSEETSFSSFSATQLSGSEVMIQISTYKLHHCSLSDMLLFLEEDGLLVINASSFESLGDKVFYNLHLQVDKSYKLEREVLRGRLFSFCDKKEELSS